MNSHPELKIDWATYDSAKHACENWHYSKAVPVNKTVKIGAWEDGKFIGVVIFSPGASANLYKAYSLSNIEGCELTRVALRNHKTPVSRIVSIAIRFLKKSNPNLKLIVSFADPNQGHHGGIYQAGNWVYVGKPKSVNIELFINGKWTHNRSVIEKYGLEGFKKIKADPRIKKRDSSFKHKYLYPLEEEIRRQIEPLRKPYPKRAGSKDIVASEYHSEGDGENPISALQTKL